MDSFFICTPPIIGLQFHITYVIQELYKTNHSQQHFSRNLYYALSIVRRVYILSANLYLLHLFSEM